MMSSYRSLFLGLCAAICFTTFTAGCGKLRINSYMQPYYGYVRDGASETQVIKSEGKPHIIISDDKAFADLAKDFKPRTPAKMHVEKKVLVYYADPWGDAEGYVVYLFINHKGVVTQAVFGG